MQIWFICIIDSPTLQSLNIFIWKHDNETRWDPSSRCSVAPLLRVVSRIFRADGNDFHFFFCPAEATLAPRSGRNISLFFAIQWTRLLCLWSLAASLDLIETDGAAVAPLDGTVKHRLFPPVPVGISGWNVDGRDQHSRLYLRREFHAVPMIQWILIELKRVERFDWPTQGSRDH